MSLIERWLSNLEPVHLAASEAELEAIFRFRYQVSVEELNWPCSDEERERGMIEDPGDRDPGTLLFYTGSPEEITGSMRVEIWPGTEVPEAMRQTLALDLLGDLSDLRLGYLGRLVIRRTMRGKLVLPSLLRRGFELCAGEREVDLVFCIAAPGLIRHYRSLGARPYAAPAVPRGRGLAIPMVIVLSDYQYLKRCGSLLAPMVRKHFGPKGRTGLDPERFRDILAAEASPIVADAEEVWADVQQRFVDTEKPALVEALPEDALRELTRSGFLLQIDAGTPVTREGVQEKELFVVLEGAFGVFREGEQVAVLDEGDLFGEIAFFTEAGVRTAEVRALSDGRVLVLRRKFLEELTKKNPKAGFQVLFNISRILADRFARVQRESALRQALESEDRAAASDEA